MGKALKLTQDASITVQDGAFAFELPTGLLRTLAPQVDDMGRVACNSSGVILANTRSKYSISTIVPDGQPGNELPAEYTISVYVTRTAITDTERNAVVDAKAASKARKTEQDAKLQQQHERDVQAAERKTRELMTEGLRLGTGTAIESVKNVAAMVPLLKQLGDAFATPKE